MHPCSRSCSAPLMFCSAHVRSCSAPLMFCSAHALITLVPRPYHEFCAFFFVIWFCNEPVLLRRPTISNYFHYTNVYIPMLAQIRRRIGNGASGIKNKQTNIPCGVHLMYNVIPCNISLWSMTLRYRVLFNIVVFTFIFRKYLGIHSRDDDRPLHFKIMLIEFFVTLGEKLLLIITKRGLQV